MKTLPVCRFTILKRWKKQIYGNMYNTKARFISHLTGLVLYGKHRFEEVNLGANFFSRIIIIIFLKVTITKL